MAVPPDWQLPPGVPRELWDYLHDAAHAATVDARLAGTPLLELDCAAARALCKPGDRVIDLGCGTGRVSVPLAQAGCAVTGVDLSPPMLALAAAKATAAGVAVTWLHANLAEPLPLPAAAFDVALCLFGTLGMVATPAARRDVLREAARVVRPGGTLLLHVHNRWHHLRTSAGRHWLLADAWKRVAGDPTAGDAAMPHHAGVTGWPMHLFGRRELLRLLRATGWTPRRVAPVAAAGPLRWPGVAAGWRAYGFLARAESATIG